MNTGIQDAGNPRVEAARRADRWSPPASFWTPITRSATRSPSAWSPFTSRSPASPGTRETLGQLRNQVIALAAQAPA